MKILIAGATGALGRRLVPLLVANGHEVVGMTRFASKRELLTASGAQAVVADALDPLAVSDAVSAAEPEVIVHQLTDLSGGIDPRRFARDFAQTNRLRREGTDILLSAGQAAGIKRFVAQSYAGWPAARTGGPVKREEDPFATDLPTPFGSTLAAIQQLEAAVAGATWVDGVALRYGAFYGPGTQTATDPDGEMVANVRKRRFPIVGGGGGVWSFVHIDDAAGATVAAIEQGGRGIYNVADDEPAAVAEWLPALAEAVGAKRPLKLPRWVGRLAAGEAAAIMMTEVRGASNAKAKRAWGWTLRYPSWRDGFRRGLS